MPQQPFKKELHREQSKSNQANQSGCNRAKKQREYFSKANFPVDAFQIRNLLERSVHRRAASPLPDSLDWITLPSEGQVQYGSQSSKQRSRTLWTTCRHRRCAEVLPQERLYDRTGVGSSQDPMWIGAGFLAGSAGNIRSASLRMVGKQAYAREQGPASDLSGDGSGR